MPLVTWINDLAMALFFLLIGLEIKRELLAGQLASFRKAALPITAAAGGMLVPGFIYALVNLNEPGLRGWGVPVATDIAFALGILTLLGPRAPVSLKVFLASLAIADDVGALVVIAIFYTEQIHTSFLLAALGIVAVLVITNWLGFRNPIMYILWGVLLWIFVHESGLHATIAGVLLAMTIPARSSIGSKQFLQAGRHSLDAFERESQESDHVMTNPRLLGAVHALDRACTEVETPLQRIEHVLHPWVAFLIVPVFALANAGVEFAGGVADSISSPITIGVILGLVLGKPFGIILSSWLAVRFGLASLPQGVTWRHMFGVACLGGIGFTMSLFIAHLAFGESAQLSEAKVGILVASALSGIIGLVILLSANVIAQADQGIRPGGSV
jgi:NhaA family Na+:H+ antiporter